MTDKTEAIENLIAQDADLIDDRDVLTTVYLTGFENGRDSERAKVKQIAGQLTEAQRDALLSMEWTGEYYEPPATERKSLAALGLLDHIYDYSVTYEGELVRAALAGKAEQ